MPDRLAARYQEALEDEQLVDLRQEVALVDARLAEVLDQLDRGESGAAWHSLQEAREELRNARARHDVAATDALEAEIDRLVDVGVTDNVVWGEVSRLIEQRRRLVDAEMRRLARLRQFLTVEQANTLLATVLAAVKQSVAENCPDRALGNRILAGVSAYLGALVARGD